MRINTNLPSLQGQRAVKQASDAQSETTTKLSSGDRITKAADDASGLAISEKLKAGIRSSMMATRNANDGISIVQTAEGGLTESSNLINRMRELAVQSANDTYSQSEREMLTVEFNQLKNEINRISETTKYNGKNLLSGDGQALDFQVGMNASSTNQISLSGDISSNANSLGIGDVTIQSKWGAQESLSKLDQAINKISGHRSKLGSIQNRLNSSVTNLEINTESISSANSRIRDADYAIESANNAKNKIVLEASTSVLAQANTFNDAAGKLVG